MTSNAVPRRRWPGLLALGAIGLVAGALTLGLAPPAEVGTALVAVIVLAAIGALAGTSR